MIGLGLSSCSFYQLCETTPIDMQQNQGLVYYENEDCRVGYDFWSEQGTVTFSILNKTDSIISIDLSETFFIRNGISNPYFQARQWSANSMLGLKTTRVRNNTFINHNALVDPIIPSYSSYTNIYSKTTAATAVATASKSESRREQQIIRIAPHSVYYFSEFNLRSKPFFDCDLETLPEYKKQASIRYTPETTPLQFSNYITYKVGNQAQQHIENKFYVSKVSNFRARTLKNNVRISRCGQYIGELRMRIFPVENTSTAFYIPYKRSNCKSDELLNIEIVGSSVISESTIQSEKSNSSASSVSSKQGIGQEEYLALQEAENQESGDKSLLGNFKAAKLVVINAARADEKKCKKYKADFMSRFNQMIYEQYYKSFMFNNTAKDLTAELVIIGYNGDIAESVIRFKDASGSILYSAYLRPAIANAHASFFVGQIQGAFKY